MAHSAKTGRPARNYARVVNAASQPRRRQLGVAHAVAGRTRMAGATRVKSRTRVGNR